MKIFLYRNIEISVTQLCVLSIISSNNFDDWICSDDKRKKKEKRNFNLSNLSYLSYYFIEERDQTSSCLN